jgi:hypothetical protein
MSNYCRGTSGFDQIGCSHIPSLCQMCHTEILTEVVHSVQKELDKQSNEKIEINRKEAILEAVEFANWYGKKISRLGGDFKGDAAFFYDEWKKEKKGME